jgi:DNA-binding SARP family transcriptional activator
MVRLDGETVALAPGVDLWVDLAEFHRTREGCSAHAGSPSEQCPPCAQFLEEAAELYRNDFLFGFTLPDCREFDEWVFLQGEQFRGELAETIAWLVRANGAAGKTGEAIRAARRWLSLDPLEEQPHRELMRLYAETGQAAAALRQYAECERVLKEELGVEPGQETVSLRSSIRRMTGASARSGHPQQPPRPDDRGEEEVRLVSVLSVGLSAAGEEAWDDSLERTTQSVSAFLAEAKEILAGFEAREEGGFGEDALAVFGVPTAHEDDAERAVRAAFAIREIGQRFGLTLSAGIHTGTVYVGGKAVMGATVNRAVRLRYEARADQVLVSDSTVRRTRRAVEYRRDEADDPSKAGTGGAWIAVSVKPAAEKPCGIEGMEARLVGRDRELDSLRQALARAREGSGQLVTIIGEAGIGKSRLVRELRENMRHTGEGDSLVWMEGRCQELGQTTSYWPFIDALSGWQGPVLGDADGGRSERLASELRNLAGHRLLTREDTEDVGPLLDDLLSLRLGTSSDTTRQAVLPNQVRGRTFRALQKLLCAVSRRAPLVLVLDDLHWADTQSLEVVSLLMEVLESHPLLLLCLLRPEADQKCWNLGSVASRKCPERFTEIRLKELGRLESRRMLESLLDVQDLPASVESLVFGRSRGNPFYIEEIVRSLVDEGAITRDGGGWRIRESISPPNVADNVVAVTQSRVDRLDVEAKRLLQCAAVNGGPSSRSVLLRILPDEEVLEESLAALERAALVFEEKTLPEPEYSFRHSLV